MQATHTRLRRLSVLLLVVVAAGVVIRWHGARSDSDYGFLPVIGGDTWPPVPVKDDPRG